MDNYIPYYKRDLQGLNKSECVDVGYAEVRKFCEVNHITPPATCKERHPWEWVLRALLLGKQPYNGVCSKRSKHKSTSSSWKPPMELSGVQG